MLHSVKVLSPVLCSDELVDMYKAFTKDFPVISIEDPFDQDDITHSQKLTAEGVCQVTPTTNERNAFTV